MELGTQDGVEARGEFRIREFDPARCRYEIPWWDALTPAEKLREAQHLTPSAEQEMENTTCVELHSLLVDCLDASQPSVPPVEMLALGRSDTAPAESDTTLNDQVDRVDVTDFDDQGDSLQVRTFVGEGDANVDTANGETLSEVGLYAGEFFLNHSLLGTDVSKDDTLTVTVSVTLTFAAA